MKSARNLMVTVAAGAALALSAAGCGEKQEPATTGPVVPETTTTTTTPDRGANPATEIVNEFLTSSDAQKVCGRLLTPAFLRKEYKDMKGCLASRRPANLAGKRPQLTATRDSAGPTTVVAVPHGGLYDGKRIRFTVVQQGKSLRIDSLVPGGSPGA